MSKSLELDREENIENLDAIIDTSYPKNKKEIPEQHEEFTIKIEK